MVASPGSEPPRRHPDSHSASPNATAAARPLAAHPSSGAPATSSLRRTAVLARLAVLQSPLAGAGPGRPVTRSSTSDGAPEAGCRPLPSRHVYLNAFTCRTSLHRTENLAAVRLSAYNDLSKHVQMILDSERAMHPRSQQALHRQLAQPDLPVRKRLRCRPRLPAPLPPGRPDRPALASSPSAPAHP